MTVRNLIKELIMFNLDAEIGVNDNGIIKDIEFGWIDGKGDHENTVRDIEQEKLNAISVSIYAGREKSEH